MHTHQPTKLDPHSVGVGMGKGGGGETDKCQLQCLTFQFSPPYIMSQVLFDGERFQGNNTTVTHYDLIRK